MKTCMVPRHKELRCEKMNRDGCGSHHTYDTHLHSLCYSVVQILRGILTAICIWCGISGLVKPTCMG